MVVEIEWKDSEAKKIIEEDLASRVLTLSSTDFPAREAWKFYKRFSAFKRIIYSQFSSGLERARERERKGRAATARDTQALAQDRRIYPRQMHNHKGEIVFDLHPAKKLLRHDIKSGNHIDVTGKQLWESRPEFQQFELSYFRRRIYQEIRRSKMINYLQMVREKEEAKKKAQPESRTVIE